MIFMLAISIGLVFLLIAFMMTHTPFLKENLRNEASSSIFKKEFWLQVWKDKGIRKRVGMTLGLVVFYRLLTVIPMPGIDLKAFGQLSQQMNRLALAGYADGSIGGISVWSPLYRQFSLFALGLYPYLASCILVQSAALMIKPLKSFLFNLENGWLDRVTIITAILIGIVQAFFLALMLEKTMFGPILIVSNPGWGFRLMTMLSAVTAMSVLIMIAQGISKKGVGQGVGVLVGSDFLFQAAFAVKNLLIDYDIEMIRAVTYALLLLLMMIVAFYLTCRGRNDVIEINGCRRCLPLRASFLGRVPVTLALFLLSLPMLWVSVFPNEQLHKISFIFGKDSFWHYPAVTVLIIILTYLYAALLMEPEKLTSLLNKYGGSLNGLNQSCAIEEMFYRIFERVTLLIAGLCLGFTLFPSLINAIIPLPPRTGALFGLGSFFIVFGAALDVIENLKAKMELTLERKEICISFIDEAEAVISQCYLMSRGIQSTIEPFRFTWGLPVKTAVDRFYLYVPKEMRERAKELLNQGRGAQ
ncbi:MAG: hypothetical protein AB1650_08275 [Candidatus Omnitrophota bacterium]